MLKSLSLSGFLQTTSATWIDSQAIEYNPSKNSLAAQRQLLQIDVNDDLTPNDSVFLRMWGVYEPSYPYENACGDPNFELVHCNSDFYNDYGIREFWLGHRLGPLQIFIGRQIVTWGESLAFRVTDQINPQDFSYTFGFANLESSRLPLWMIHPIVHLPAAGPLTSNFAELVYVPGFDFGYTHVDYTDDLYDGQDQVAGRVDINPPNGGRFAPRPDGRIIPAPSGPFDELVGAPPIHLVRTMPGCPPPGQCLVIAGGDNDRFGVSLAIPRATWGNSQIGVRLHTLAYNTEITALWLWNHDYDAVIKLDSKQITAPFGADAPFRKERARLIFPQYMGAGVTANRPVYLPGWLERLPSVIRTEAFYKNHATFNTLDVPGDFFVGFNPLVGTPSALYHSDEVLWLMSLDVGPGFVPFVSETGNISANFEVQGTTILSYSHRLNAGGYFERVNHNDVNLLLNITTSWWWGAVAPAWVTIYNPDGQTFLLFPSLQLTPPWTDKYLLKLQWIEVLGTNQFGIDGGVFKGKSMLVAQFQYNFSLF